MTMPSSALMRSMTDAPNSASVSTDLIAPATSFLRSRRKVSSSLTLSSSFGGLLRICRAPPARLTHGLHNNHRLTLRTSSPVRRWLCSIFTLAQLVRLGKGLAGSCRVEHPPCRQSDPRQFRPVLGHEASQSAKRAPRKSRNADSGVYGHWALILILCDWRLCASQHHLNSDAHRAADAGLAALVVSDALAGVATAQAQCTAQL